MTVDIRVGDCREVLRALAEKSVQCCVTSPPYFGLRDYGVAGQIGLEPTPSEYVAEMVAVFREVRRVLADDGTLWLNLGDSYNAYNGNRGRSTSFQAATEMANPVLPQGFGLTVKALANKQLLGIPWAVAFALRDDGWILRSDIIWHKPNPMPESVTDRPTKAHEYLFLLTKSPAYYYDSAAIAEPVSKGDAGSEFHTGKTAEHQLGRASTKPRKAGKRAFLTQTGGIESSGLGVTPDETRNRRSVWTVATQPFSGAHFATFPPALIEPCILAGSKPGDTVLDPFGGAGTTGLVADRHRRHALLIELNPSYAELARRRITDDSPLFAEVTDGAA